MASTEQQAALAKVRQARDEVDELRNDAGLSDADATLLAQLWVDLDDLDGKLVLEDLSEQLDAIQHDADDLKAQCDRMRQGVAQLAQAATVIEDVAKAVDGVVSAAKAASGAGLV